MTAFADLITRVADDLNRSDVNSQIDRELRRAVMHYERQRWWFNEHQTTTTASSSQADYSLPADLLVLDEIEITVSNRRLRLTEITWDRYLDEYRYNSVASEPSDWAYYADKFWLGPVPNQAYVLTVHYVRTLYPASFSDGTDNAWTNYADDLITARALKTMGARTLQHPNAQLTAWQELERQAYSALCAMNEQRLMTGKVRPWSG
jgi:hypothetical protein